MRTFICIFLIWFLAFNLKSQNKSLDDFLKNFEHDLTELSDTDALAFFDVTYDQEIIAVYTGKILLKNNNFTAFTCVIPCASGGQCERTVLAVFNKNGKRTDKLYPFETIIGDMDVKNWIYCSMASDSILLMVNYFTEMDYETGEEKENISTELIKINEQGKIIKVNNPKIIDSRRLYKSLSYHLLTDEDLVNKTREELETMKFEIYAAYGYLFNNEKWDIYFRKTSWYKPEHEKVEHLFNIVEKKNIDIISQKEKTLIPK